MLLSVDSMTHGKRITINTSNLIDYREMEHEGKKCVTLHFVGGYNVRVNHKRQDLDAALLPLRID